MVQKENHILLSQRFFPEEGGSIRWLYEVYRRWPLPVDVITHRYQKQESLSLPDGSLREIIRKDIQLDNWGIDTPGRILRYGRMVYFLYRKLKKLSGKTVIHCHHIVPEGLCALIVKKLSTREVQIVAYAHGEEIEACKTSKQLSFLLRYGLKNIDTVIANSENTQKLLLDMHLASQVHVVHPGVQYSDYQNLEIKRKEWRHRQGIKEEDIILLTVGRIEKRKNHCAVIECLNRLQAEFPQVRYYIIGSGEEENSLRKQVKDLKLQEKVYFSGRVSEEERIACLAGCDIFVMPSVRDGSDIEGFGIVYVEASAAGKAVIGGQSGGEKEAVIDGKTGMLVDGLNLAHLESALRKLIQDMSYRKELGQNGREHARELDWSKVVERTLKLTISPEREMIE